MTVIHLRQPVPDMPVYDHTGAHIGTAKTRDDAERLQKRHMAHSAPHLLQLYDGCDANEGIPLFRIPGFPERMRPVRS